MAGGIIQPGRGALIVATLFVSACHPVRGHVNYIGPQTGFMKVNARLDCPDRSGDLIRSGIAADGLSCIYSGPNDETVSLQLQSLAGATPQAALSKVETQLKGEAGPGGFDAPTPPPPPPPPSSKTWDAGDRAHSGDDDRDDDDNDNDNKESSDKGDAKIDLPGLHIATQGDKADVRLPGLSIHTDGDKAQVQAGWWGRSANISGHNGGATIRLGRAGPGGVDAMVILASDRPGPSGYRTVGYVAKGPPAGPLVIATFKSRGGDRSDHDLAGDGVKKLVNLNVQQGLGWFSNSKPTADKDAQP